MEVSENQYFSDLLFATAKYLTCGLDLEFVASEESQHLIIGQTRIDFAMNDLEHLRDFVLSFQVYVCTLEDNLSNYKFATGFQKVLVSNLLIKSSKPTFDFVLSTEAIVTGELEIDARIVAGHLDTLFFAYEEVSSAVTR